MLRIIMTPYSFESLQKHKMSLLFFKIRKCSTSHVWIQWGFFFPFIFLVIKSFQDYGLLKCHNLENCKVCLLDTNSNMGFRHLLLD